MATPNVIKVEPLPTFNPSIDGYLFQVWTREGAETEPWNVAVSRSQSMVAGFGEDGPSCEWVRERFLRRATRRLENYRPVREQLHEWWAEEHPWVLHADS